MPVQQIADSDIEYFLVQYDENCQELVEGGIKLSDTICAELNSAHPPITDVFVCSHGWLGDKGGAISQYDLWISAMATCAEDLKAMQARRPGFNPLLVGLHWPSLPWGMYDESTQRAATLAATSATAEPDVDALASQLGDTAEMREALRRIFAYADTAHSLQLDAAIADDFAIVFDAASLRLGGANGRPGADQDGFDAQAIVTETSQIGSAPSRGVRAPGTLGLRDDIRDAILSPLRQLSFWKMKDRARQFGETAANALLVAMQGASDSARFHLMGHSFGCIVVSGMVAGSPDAQSLPLRRPVNSLYLVQGALSLWSYASDVPYAPGTPGYFRRILDKGLVSGPLLTTRSTFDTAVGKFYPLGVGVRQQFLLGGDGDEKYPKYGGIGALGIRGADQTVDMPMSAADQPYDFSEGRIFNLEASHVIRNGGGASGAHCDIAHPEVAHAFWCAAMAPGIRQGEGPGMLGDVLDDLVKRSVSRGVRRQSDEFRGGLPGDSDTPAEPPVNASGSNVPFAPVADEARWIQAGFEGLAPGEPIMPRQWYTLAFEVDRARQAGAAASKLNETGLFAEGESDITLTVQLDTDDFETSERLGRMRIPRKGNGYTKARFDLSPRRTGPCALTATILKDGQFIQQMNVQFDVGTPGAAPEVQARGRALAGAAVLQPRDLSLQIYPNDRGGYDCVVCNAVATRVRLPINAALIDSAIATARNALMQVVKYEDAGRFVFQGGLDIPEDASAQALRIMAQAGAMLFMQLFNGPGAGDDVRAVGRALQELSTEACGRLRIQVIAETLPVPWSLLYMGDARKGAQLDWDKFLGMRHIVEQIPLQNPMSVSKTEISTQPTLDVGLNFNTGIDAAMGANFVQSQRSFWATRQGVSLQERHQPDDFIGALAQEQGSDQIVYLYCHAVSKGLTESGGPGASTIILDGPPITLNDLKLNAPTTDRLPGKPLVFINACESAEMSPTFYDGFVPYFMDKGARGVIGTECQMPALFAKEWADRFFTRFLAGGKLGEVVVDLRREFLKQHRNPLGLLYAVYCDADTAVRPALP